MPPLLAYNGDATQALNLLDQQMGSASAKKSSVKWALLEPTFSCTVGVRVPTRTPGDASEEVGPPLQQLAQPSVSSVARVD